MKHPHSFAFYFLYSHSRASPAAGCSFRAHKAPATRRVRDGARRAGGPGQRCPTLAPASLLSAWLVLTSPHSLPTLCKSYRDSTELVPHRDCAPENPVPGGKSACYFKWPSDKSFLITGQPNANSALQAQDPVPDESTASKEHESIVTRIWDAQLGDGPQPFQWDELPAALMKCK